MREAEAPLEVLEERRRGAFPGRGSLMQRAVTIGLGEERRQLAAAAVARVVRRALPNAC